MISIVICIDEDHFRFNFGFDARFKIGISAYYFARQGTMSSMDSIDTVQFNFSKDSEKSIPEAADGATEENKGGDGAEGGDAVKLTGEVGESDTTKKKLHIKTSFATNSRGMAGSSSTIRFSGDAEDSTAANNANAGAGAPIATDNGAGGVVADIV
jgi:hypothetical protein